MIDLIGHRIQALTLIFSADELDLPVDGSIIPDLVSLGGIQPRESPENVVFETSYKASNRLQHVFLSSEEQESGGVSLAMHVRRGAVRRRRGATRGADVVGALDYFATRNVSGVGFCQISFLVPRRQFKTVIPIPLTIFQQGAFPFDRLMGFRLGTGQRGESEESLIVDTHENDLHLALTYSRRFDVDQKLLLNVARASKDMIIPLIVRSREVQNWHKLESGI